MICGCLTIKTSQPCETQSNGWTQNVETFGWEMKDTQRFSFCWTFSGIGLQTITQTTLVLSIFQDSRLLFIANDHEEQRFFPTKMTVALTIPPATSFKLFKTNELNWGGVQLHGATEGTFQRPPPIDIPVVEFVGDSLTSGFGNITNSPCDMDCTQTWCMFLAKEFGWFPLFSSLSGVGLISNFDGSTSSTIRQVRARIPQNHHLSSWTPRVVFINIGTNDFTLHRSLDFAERFGSALHSFIRQIRSEWGRETKVIVVIGPIIEAVGAETCERVARACKADGMDVDFMSCNGCLDGRLDCWGYAMHPNVKGHRRMADVLIPQLKRMFNSN